MYVNTKNIFKESWEFTLKNLSDFLNGSNASLKDYEKKMENNKKEFYNLYRLYNEEEQKIHKSIIEYNSKSKLYEIIDFAKVDSFHHLHLFMKLDSRYFSKMDLVKVYSIYHKLLSGSELNGYYTKYIFTKPINDKYIVFIAFDEKKVHSVEALASENMFDISANIKLIKLDINTNIFNKDSKK